MWNPVHLLAYDLSISDLSSPDPAYRHTTWYFNEEAVPFPQATLEEHDESITEALTPVRASTASAFSKCKRTINERPHLRLKNYSAVLPEHKAPPCHGVNHGRCYTR
jgi:hypothetical protein